MELVYFLGRFHVLVLHLPIGVLSLAIVFEVLTRWPSFAPLKPVIPWTWFAGGVAGVATVALGLMHATESGFDGSSAVEAHRLAGITLTALAFVIWLLSIRLSPTTVAVWPGWAKSARLDEAYARLQPYWTKGGPIDRLYSKSGWIVASVLTFIMMSVTGHLGGNLTHGETYLVQYAPKPIRRLAHIPDPPREAPKALARSEAVAAKPASSGYDEDANLPTVQPADAKTIAALETNGFVVRPVANRNALLDVDYTLPRPITDADLQALGKIGPQVLRLNLRRAGLTDAQLKPIGQLPNLRRLRLEANAVGDAGLAQLGGLKSLRYLNLVGTKVSDAGLQGLGKLETLHEVYVWQSGATDAGIAAFRAQRPQVVVNGGLKPTDIVKETRILKPR